MSKILNDKEENFQTTATFCDFYIRHEELGLEILRESAIGRGNLYQHFLIKKTRTFNAYNLPRRVSNYTYEIED